MVCAGHTSFDTDGFTVGSDTNVNQSSINIVAWQWKANGGTTSSNTDGSITSTVQVNDTAGFSIVTYTGNGTEGATVGHGLVVLQKLFYVKIGQNARKLGCMLHQDLDGQSTLFLNIKC